MPFTKEIIGVKSRYMKKNMFHSYESVALLSIFSLILWTEETINLPSVTGQRTEDGTDALSTISLQEIYPSVVPKTHSRT